jgi:transposase
MRAGIDVEVSAADRARLEAVVANRNSPQKHVWRARIILATADGLGMNAIRRRTGKSKPCVWRWQERFAAEGVAGLLRDKTRPSRIPPLSQAVIDRVVALTTRDPPHAATHWTAAAMAQAVGISLSSVQRIWRAHRLRPHQIRTFKLSKDPQFAAKLRAIVGLYVDPPAHAVVLSLDEKPQIQALDRTQPGLPVKPGRCATMTHDYERHGTTTLFAALNVLDGRVVGRCMQRHRHQEFIRFLNAVEAAVPAGKLVHAVLDNYATHKPGPPRACPRGGKHPKVRAWLARHPRWTFHFTPTSASPAGPPARPAAQSDRPEGRWLNAVEGLFAKLTRRRLKRGVFGSLVELQAAIHRFLAETNDNPKPFVWTAKPEHILEKVGRGNQALEQTQ